MKKKTPVVTIVGRPNTGKSSLFNLIIGKRKSIVHEEEGVTRDINTEIIKIDDYLITICDTAGYLESEDSFNQIVRKKVEEAVHNTDLVLLTIDGREIHPIDYEIAKFLKKLNKNVIIVANKLDNKDMEHMAFEAHSLGFEKIIPFSVLHKRGLNTLKEKIIENLKELNKLKTTLDTEEEIKIAIVGKPNVGKSMLVNAILGYERSIVSEIAGTTRDAIDDIFKFNGKQIRLIDTAGLRRKSKVEENIEYFSNVRAIQSIERSDVVIQLIDSTSPITHQDKTITQTVISKDKPLIIAYNKWDIIHKTNEENYFLMEEYKRKLYDEIPAYPFVPVEFISAKEKYKIQKLLNTALKVYEDSKFRVSTSVLNEWLEKNIRESNVEYPISDLKVYYATQIDVSPPHFVFFINHKKHLKKDYKRFLENRLRLAFEFTGVPIKITFKEKED
ncbi:MAG: ribosome biogenesis GTPase Der [Brevinematia bacterium]